MNGAHGTNRLWLGVYAGTILATGIAVFLFVHLYSIAVREAFQARGAAYAAALADAIAPWVASGDEALIQEAARLLLVGSSLYVQIVQDGAVITDVRTRKAAALSLSPSSSPDGWQINTRRLSGGPPYLDVIIPYRSGYVRVGIDATPAVVRARNAALLGAGLGLLLDLFVLASLHLIKRERGAASAPRIEHGPLQIDDAARRVTMRSVPIPLPPKQYALLRLLASAPERVFTEEEILAAVWPDSPYADSKDVKQCVYLLRQRLGKEDGRIVVNVPGFGYKLSIPED